MTPARDAELAIPSLALVVVGGKGGGERTEAVLALLCWMQGRRGCAIPWLLCSCSILSPLGHVL